MHNLPRTLAAASVAAILTLSACNEPETIKANELYDPQAQDLAKAPPVELPPAIAASRTYRCSDNSLVYATFYTNDTVRVSPEQGADGTVLTSTGQGQPYTAEGYSLSANAPTITYSAPGKRSQSCHA